MKHDADMKVTGRQFCMVTHIFKIITVGIALHVWMPLAALAFEPPGEAEVSSSIAAELPSYWAVQSVEITASVNDGDDVDPRYRQRFVADAIPTEDLYMAVSEDDWVGPFRMLITTHAATESRKLYGVATSALSLGKWSTQISLENSVKGVGSPRSLYSEPVVIAGAEQAGEVAEEFLKLHEVSKTVTEGLVRRTASSEVLKKLAEEEKAALEEGNRQRLIAFEEKYRQEVAAFIAGMERERGEIVADINAKLAIVRTELKQETAKLDAQAAALEQERKLLIEENQRSLEALQAEFERKRAEIAAVAETLDAIAVAEAETEAQKKLAAAQKKLAEETKNASDVVQQAQDAAIKKGKLRYEIFLAALRSEDLGERNARVDAVLESADNNLKEIAINEAMKSGDDVLQAKALKALMARQPKIAIMATRKDKDGKKVLWYPVIEVTSFDEQTLSFAGVFSPNIQIGACVSGQNGYKPQYAPKAQGTIQRDKVTLIGKWYRHKYSNNRPCYNASSGLQQYSCAVTVQADDKGLLTGSGSCGGPEYSVQLNL